MNVQRLIEKYKRLEGVWDTEGAELARQIFLQDLEQLDELETGHADEAPRYLKNILARLRELPLHDREVWLKAIMSEFEQDFCHAKWREGYEQGKFEGEWVGNQLKDADKIRCELNREKVPQFAADWYEENKDDFETSLFQCIYEIFGKRNDSELNEFENWVIDENIKPFQTLVNMHQFGYEVEEKKYKITLLNRNDGDLYLINQNAGVSDKYGHFSPVVLLFTKGTNFSEQCYELTKKEVASNGFGWVFNCPGVQIKEVE